MNAVLLIGIQGAGKTTFYRERFASTHAHISADVTGSRESALKLLAECIAAQRDFVVDNTNATRRERALYIEPARAAGYAIHGYFFNPTVRQAIGRNNHRTDKRPIPVPALLATFKRLETPALDEGFDELFTLK